MVSEWFQKQTRATTIHALAKNLLHQLMILANIKLNELGLACSNICLFLQTTTPACVNILLYTQDYKLRLFSSRIFVQEISALCQPTAFSIMLRAKQYLFSFCLKMSKNAICVYVLKKNPPPFNSYGYTCNNNRTYISVYI